jgi:DNA repair exonuclease SbcCD nuclease subunit
MPKALFYTDPHLGLSRKAHYTEASSRAREAWVNSELFQLLQDSKNSGHAARFCLGDFYDRESISEQTILDSLPIAHLSDAILCGNHDAVNRSGRATSFHLLAEMVPGTLSADYHENLGFSVEVGSTMFCFAPHVLTQAAYEGMIEDLRQEASKFPGYRVLCLHCNWDMDPERISESTLNLTPELTYRLLSDFHHILLGHVHTPQEIYEGRVKIIGSVFPTAFDNMENKRCLIYDTETGVFSEQQTWTLDRYYSGPASLAPGGLMQYYDLLDDLPPGEAQKLATDLFRAGAFGVRLRRPEEEEEKGERKEVSVAAFHRLPETISQELQESRPHLVPLWDEVSHA